MDRSDMNNTNVDTHTHKHILCHSHFKAEIQKNSFTVLDLNYTYI